MFYSNKKIQKNKGHTKSILLHYIIINIKFSDYHWNFWIIVIKAYINDNEPRESLPGAGDTAEPPHSAHRPDQREAGQD